MLTEHWPYNPHPVRRQRPGADALSIQCHAQARALTAWNGRDVEPWLS